NQEIPDANLAESLGRLPGVSDTSSAGEGDKVIVRGMDARYNLVSVNGVRAPSSSSDDNSVSLAGISPFMVDGIEVKKTLTPDYDADVVGGIIDLKLKDAEEGFHVNMLLQNRFPGTLQGKTFNPLATLQLSNRFFKNKLGVTLVGNYERINRISNRVENYVGLININPNRIDDGGVISPRPSSTFYYGDIIRERKGLSLFMDFKLENTKITFSSFINGLDDETIDRSMTVGNPTLSKGIDVSSFNTLTYINAFSIEQKIHSTKLKISAAYNKAASEKPYDYNIGQTRTFTNTELSQEARDLISGYNIGPYYAANILGSLANDSSFYMSTLSSEANDFTEDEKNG
ncbi:MAG: TonB-dependent receptor plug domain-containing protein, partial [Bacteroidales bacterium]|nr:TonB-dependent receptor plug domain-containing protein [Bacteroidales bacterium]